MPKKELGEHSANDLYTAGLRYERGDGVARNCYTAVELYKKAADAGSHPAQQKLTQIDKLAHAVTVNDQMAVTMYQEAAAKGNLSLVDYLTSLGADVKMPTAEGSTP